MLFDFLDAKLRSFRIFCWFFFWNFFWFKSQFFIILGIFVLKHNAVFKYTWINIFSTNRWSVSVNRDYLVLVLHIKWNIFFCTEANILSLRFFTYVLCTICNGFIRILIKAWFKFLTASVSSLFTCLTSFKFIDLR